MECYLEIYAIFGIFLKCAAPFSCKNISYRKLSRKDIFYFYSQHVIISSVGNKVGKKVGDKRPLNSRRQKIISEMRDNPNITTAELHNILGVSETAVEKNISFLRDNVVLEYK